MPKERNSQSVRIISGKYRGRKLQFPDLPGLRPTLGRTRETLFNWLQGQLPGARCLDLFAGSGALGFEALSRGAEQVVFVEQQRAVCQALRSSAEMLQLTPGSHQILHQDCAAYLQDASERGESFDLIFVDPPFQAEHLQPALEALVDGRLLRAEGLIYYECAAGLTTSHPSLAQYRQASAGDYQYGLLHLS